MEYLRTYDEAASECTLLKEVQLQLRFVGSGTVVSEASLTLSDGQVVRTHPFMSRTEGSRLGLVLQTVLVQALAQALDQILAGEDEGQEPGLEGDWDADEDEAECGEVDEEDTGEAEEEQEPTPILPPEADLQRRLQEALDELSQAAPATCAACGARLGEDWQYCPLCGAHVR